MGTLNHLQRFVPDLHTHTMHFLQSLKSCIKQFFTWEDKTEMAFKNIIIRIAENPSLFHYDS